MSQHQFTYLALGDSYTIGESVPLHNSYPYQTVQLLRKNGYHFQAPEIIAQTGWTSFELAEKMLHTQLNEHYDFVSLLIGVNNQYRGLSSEEFKTDFDFLLHKAIHFAGKPAHVTVLSIPDWGQTPFASNKDSKKIGKEIDQLNIICRQAAEKTGAGFINITDDTRKAATDKDLLAADHLHYSGKEYAVWAEKLAGLIKQQIRN